MEAKTPNEEDFSLFMSENGHLSFENPNYRLDGCIDPARLDDHLNSNVQPSIPMSVFEELRLQQELKRLSSGSSSPSSTTSASRRKTYAALDPMAMGVDTEAGPKTALDNKIREEKLSSAIRIEEVSKGEMESEKLLEEDKEKAEKSDGEEDTKEVVVVKRREKKKGRDPQQLPPGWERHEDDEGPYFWHIKSGTIQREHPGQADHVGDNATVVRDVRSSRLFEDDFDPLSTAKSMSKSCTTSSIANMAKDSSGTDTSVVPKDANNTNDDGKWKRKSMPPPRTDSADFMQVQVRSLGCVELREDELTPENSSKAVNKCIVQLSGSPTNAPGVWGEGKELLLELSDGSLRLVQPESGSVLNSQPIHSIRVWGVGRDNGQDFAYVARDKLSRKHLCHVFRCDIPARSIANALRDICKKILIERSLVQSSSRITASLNKESSTASSSSTTSSSASRKSSTSGSSKKRPTSLGSNFNTKLQTKTVPAPESFPTPMEEPRKVMKCWFLGTLQVNKPCGMDVLNGAINELVNSVPRAQWRTVSVAVAPSTVTITGGEDQAPPLDCRVRFLSFLGIGENPQQCAFIMHTAQDTFVAHVFHCEPTAGQLCKTIEAACKLRYQKCLDARPQAAHGRAGPGGGVGLALGPRSTKAGISSTLKNIGQNVLGVWSKRSGLQSPPPS